MTELTRLFDDLSLKLNIQTVTDQNSEILKEIIKCIDWNVQEMDDECDFYEVEEEKMNLIAYRSPTIKFLNRHHDGDFAKTFQAPEKQNFFTLREIIQTIVVFEKEARQLKHRLLSNNKIDKENSCLEYVQCIKEENGDIIFALKWNC